MNNDNMMEENSLVRGVNSMKSLPLGPRPSKEAFALDSLLTKDVSTSGSFVVRSIRTTTLERLLEAQPIPAILLDSSCCVVFANQACGRISPRHEELEGRPFSSFFRDRSSMARAESLLNEVYSSRKPTTIEGALEIADKEIWCRMHLRSIRRGRTRFLLIIVEDLTREKEQLSKNRKRSKKLEQQIHKRRMAERELRETVARLTSLLDATPDAVYFKDAEGWNLVANKAFERLTRLDNQETRKGTNRSLPPLERLKHTNDIDKQIVGSGQPSRFEECWTDENDEVTCFETIKFPIFDDHGRIIGLGGIARDITDRKRAEELVVRAKKEWESTFDSVSDLIAILDKDHRVIRLNLALAERLGVEPRDVVGTRLFNGPNEAGTTPPPCHERLVAEGRGYSEEIQNGRLGGIFDVRVTPLYDRDGQLMGCVHVARDITERKRAEHEREQLIAELTGAKESLQFQATHDGLSGLLNRVTVLDTLHRELSRADRENSPLAVIMVDVDHFKQINDQSGHLAGDAVLQGIATRIAKSVRAYDSVGRYGGEEFLVVLPGCNKQSAERMAERLRRSFSENPVVTPEGTFPITMSLGVITVDTPEKRDVDFIIRAADEALYRAKNRGRNQVEFW